MKIFFFESVGVPGGSPELRKGNSGWVPSLTVFKGLDMRLINVITTCLYGSIDNDIYMKIPK